VPAPGWSGQLIGAVAVGSAARSRTTVALTTIPAQRAGKQLQLNRVHIVHAENGKATEAWAHSCDSAGAAGF